MVIAALSRLTAGLALAGGLTITIALALAAAPARATIIVGSSDPRCISLGGPFPPGLDWIDRSAGTGLVLGFMPAIAAPVDFTVQPPASLGPPTLPDLGVAIGSATCASASRAPQLDGVTVASPALALLTTSSCDGVAFVDPASGALRAATVTTPASLPPGVFPLLPAPGASASRVAVSTRMCVAVPPGTLDSRGEPVAYDCGRGEPSYYTSFTSGAAVAAGRLFASTSNVGANAGTLDPQFLPGTVLVFALADEPGTGLAASPHPTTPAILTTAFNPTQVTAYTTPAGRELVLVGASGALGLVQDDPRTPYRETGGAALSDAAIDVIDAEQLRLVATIPLGPAGLAFERLAIDPGRQVAVIGSAIAREVFAVDLAPLDALAPDAPFVRLDGQDGPRAAILDAAGPLVLPALPGGAAPAACPGFVVGIDFAGPGRAWATDFCDGTLTEIAVATSAAPLSPSAFQVRRTIPLVAPVGPDSLGLAQAPGALRARAALDGGSELAVLVGHPEGLACAIAIPEPTAAGLAAAAATTLTLLAAHRVRRHPGR